MRGPHELLAAARRATAIPNLRRIRFPKVEWDFSGQTPRAIANYSAMKPARLTAQSLLLLGAVLLPAGALFSKDEPGDEARRADLKTVSILKSDFLKSVTCISIPRDGKFLYASAFASNTVAVFKRDAETGKIENESWMEMPELQSAVSVRLSTDNLYAAVSAFGADTISLFKRDGNTGELILLDAATEGKDGSTGLDFVIDAAFSTDNRFLYTAASTGLGIFKIEKDKLAFVKAETGGGRIEGARAVVLSPDGNILYVAAHESGTVGVFRRDKETGKLETVQILADGEDGIGALAGAFRIACSQDGRHVYVSSGRFFGDQAVSAFATQADGKLKLIEEHVNGTGGFTGFEGGNSIAISPDGRFVYAVASVSDRLARFRRDPESGRLTFLGSQVAGASASPGAAGLCFSPDGKFVYVADESSDSIVIFQQP